MLVLFRTDSFKTHIDSFKTHIDYRQFQKFLLVVDSFGPNRCGKYVLKSFRIFGQRKYKTSNFSSLLLEKCWFMFLILFEHLMDNFKKILIDSLKIFGLIRTDSFKIPRFKGRQFQIFWIYIHPWKNLRTNWQSP